MKVTHTFRHMDGSCAIKEHMQQKLAGLSRYEDHELSIHAIYSVERFNRYVEVTAHGAGHTFVAHETAEDMYEAIDLVVDKLDRQLSKEKSKRKHHKGNQRSMPEFSL